MRFIHIADLHLDAPYLNVSDIEGFGKTIRLESRNAFLDVIEYIKDEKIEYLFISGDFYENEYIRLSTIEFVAKEFEKIPFCKVFIAPGNHDPYILNSYYNTYKFPDNVRIFNGFEKVEEEDIDIYGFGFTNFYEEDLKIDVNLNKEKINILIMHSALDSSDDKRPYNPQKTSDLKKLGFDYIALGHIHKRDDTTNITYPGSLQPLGFDETGEHGFLDVYLDKKTLKTNFKKIDRINFKIKEVEVDQIKDMEELAIVINQFKQALYKVVLIGTKHFDIDVLELNKLLSKNILKVVDCSKYEVSIDELKNENTLKGIFFTLLDEQKDSLDKESYDKIFELGLEIFK